MSETKKPHPLPVIHLNGTSASELLDSHRAALKGLGGALDALRRAAPNGRDYYPLGPDAFAEARDAHLARVAAIEGIIAEVEATALYIMDAGKL